MQSPFLFLALSPNILWKDGLREPDATQEEMAFRKKKKKSMIHGGKMR